jgi:hypothetical protein
MLNHQNILRVMELFVCSWQGSHYTSQADLCSWSSCCCLPRIGLHRCAAPRLTLLSIFLRTWWWLKIHLLYVAILDFKITILYCKWSVKRCTYLNIWFSKFEYVYSHENIITVKIQNICLAPKFHLFLNNQPTWTQLYACFVFCLLCFLTSPYSPQLGF